MHSEEDLLEYISMYCTEFMTENERLASRHYTGTVKFLKDSLKSDIAKANYEKFATTKTEALELLRFGYDTFVENYAKRILEEHGEELNLNLCPNCGGIARTPKAKQCRYCQYSW